MRGQVSLAFNTTAPEASGIRRRYGNDDDSSGFRAITNSSTTATVEPGLRRSAGAQIAQVSAAGDAELAVHTLQQVVDGADRHVEVQSDLLGGATRGDQRGDLGLAERQGCKSRMTGEAGRGRSRSSTAQRHHL